MTGTVQIRLNRGARCADKLAAEFRRRLPRRVVKDDEIGIDDDTGPDICRCRGEEALGTLRITAARRIG